MPEQHARSRTASSHMPTSHTPFISRIVASGLQIYGTFTLISIIVVTLVYLLPHQANPLRLPLFDSSSLLALQIGHDFSKLRWDAIHFLEISQHGYRFEQHLAFQPGWSLLLNLLGRGVHYLKFGSIKVAGSVSPTAREILFGGTTFNVLISGIRALTLHRLTSTLISKPFANFVIVLYLFAPTPAVLVSPYTEPLFAVFTFAGLYLTAKRKYLFASLLLAGATSIRATGIFYAPLLLGIALYPIPLNRPKAVVKTLVRVAVPCGILVFPFLAFQWYSYQAFCVPDRQARPWCSKTLPFAYSFAQKQYWNVGFLTYWTVAQIPNLLIAFPVLAPSIVGLYRFARSTSRLPQHLLPFILHHALMTFLLIFSSHTQIVLRLCSTDPVFWWLLADLSWRGDGTLTRSGKIWLAWSIVWGAVSIVLWAGHYPPA